MFPAPRSAEKGKGKGKAAGAADELEEQERQLDDELAAGTSRGRRARFASEAGDAEAALLAPAEEGGEFAGMDAGGFGFADFGGYGGYEEPLPAVGGAAGFGGEEEEEQGPFQRLTAEARRERSRGSEEDYEEEDVETER